LTLLALSSGGTLTASAAQQADEAALLTAVREGRVDDVRTLLDQGTDVNARNEDGWTPLLFAAMGGHAEVVALLLERGADVNARSMRTEDGDSAVTALILAARYGHADVVSALLDGGAEVNATSRNGLSPLEAAASGGNTEVVTLLVERGADASGVALAPLTAKPEIRDRRRALESVLRHYPRHLYSAGIGGTVHVWALIGTDGRVLNAQVSESSGNELLDRAALSVVREIEFTPALSDGVPLAAWVDFPISFGGSEAVGPKFRDPGRAAEIILSYHPKYLQDRGIGGTVYVKMFIGTDGRVERAEVERISGHPALDQAALRAAREFMFTPAHRDGVPFATWVTIPITFRGR
jgi:TonB family protein